MAYQLALTQLSLLQLLEKPMCSKNVSGRLSSLWGQGMKKINGSVKMNNTLIRKSIQTFCRRECPEMNKQISEKLLHHDKTAEKYYNVIKRGEEAVATSKFIAETLKGVPTTTCVDKPASESENFEEDAIECVRWSEEDIELLLKEFEGVDSFTMDMTNKMLKEKDSLEKFRDNPKRVIDKLRHLRGR